MIQKILLPLDGSNLSGQALAPAKSLLANQSGEIIIMTVPSYHTLVLTEPDGLGVHLPYQSVEKSKEAFTKYLDNIKRSHESPDLKIRTILAEGDPATLIVEQAEISKADLIVMATHGYTGFKRWQLGSVTEKVLAVAPCPVLAVRSPDAIEHILLTVDGSSVSETAIDPALEIARQLGARVTMLIVKRAMRQNNNGQVKVIAGAPPTSITDDADHARLMEYLSGLRRQCSRPGPEIDIEVAQGPVAATILDYAKAKKVDLIAIATHGRTGLRRWVYGSISSRVLHHAECAVLVVRPPADMLR